eukprot:m.269007 g.269007  ORF g.269007 m.269007 type:complete len:323 (+) comp81699_c0_seq1:358-1326(+)
MCAQWTSHTLPAQLDVDNSTQDGSLRQDDDSHIVAHHFTSFKLSVPGWCDHCEQLIWGILQSAMICKDCGFLSHGVCATDNTSACTKLPLTPLNQDFDNILLNARYKREESNNIANVSEQQSLQELLQPRDIINKIEVFNKRTPAFKITLGGKRNEEFSGCVRISLNLSQPVKTTDHGDPNNRVVKGFWRVPGGLTKTVRLTSAMSTEEVIDRLIAKMNILNTRTKFALFELDHESRRLRQLQPFEKPLVLILLWNNSKHKALSLQERPKVVNAWEEFALVELQNFVRALDKEEEAAIKQIEASYGNKIKRMNELLAAKCPE